MVYVDKEYSDKRLAALYDLLNPWGPSDDFYLELVMAADSVLDVGCGTGLLLKAARRNGHSGRLVGLDPAEGMLDVARQEPNVDWIQGDLSTVTFDQEFDLVFMTGHVFQVFLKDDHLRQTLSAVRAAMKDDGRFAFETRNPAVRAWENWSTEEPFEIEYPGGGTVRVENQVELPVKGDRVTFGGTVMAPNLDGPETGRSTLRFLDADSVFRFLIEAGLRVEEQYGFWDRSPLTDTSPEIIVIARRA